MSWRFWWEKPKPKLRLQLRVGGRLMWDISEAELRALVDVSGGTVEQVTRTQFANTLVEFTVSEYPPI